MTKDESIQDGFQRLAQGEVTEGLYEATQAALCKQQNDPEKAASFITYLHGQLPDKMGMCSVSGLNREIRRWLTQTENPVRFELWRVASESLLALEADGEVCRPAELRRYNNRNDTPWFLPGYERESTQRYEANDWATFLPTLNLSGAEHRRVMRPTEMKEALLVILQRSNGPLAMKEIVDVIHWQVPDLNRIQEPYTTGDGTENVPDALRDVEHGLDIAEEIDLRSDAIWKKARKLGRSVPGDRVLCCYFLPRHLLASEVRLDDLGNAKTVSTVVTSLKAVLAEHIPIEQARADSPHSWHERGIAHGIFQRLLQFCSESGLADALQELLTDTAEDLT